MMKVVLCGDENAIHRFRIFGVRFASSLFLLLDKEYLVDGELKGKDLESTRAPQRYGYTDLDTFMETNHYLDDVPTKAVSNHASSLATTEVATPAQ
jgi:hypothetical protein